MLTSLVTSFWVFYCYVILLKPGQSFLSQPLAINGDVADLLIGAPLAGLTFYLMHRHHQDTKQSRNDCIEREREKDEIIRDQLEIIKQLEIEKARRDT